MVLIGYWSFLYFQSDWNIFSIVLFYFYFHFSDSETTEDEGGDQFETKEDEGDVEDQAVPTGIHHGSSLQLLLLLMFFYLCFTGFDNFIDT